MSCVTPKDNPLEQNPSKATFADKDRLLFQIADGLHVLAQPLTVLRSALVTLNADIPEADKRWYIQTSAEHIEYASRVFLLLQDLLVANFHPAERMMPMKVAELVEGTMVADQGVLKKANVELQITSGSALPSAYGDKDRTLEALLATLDAVLSISASEDPVELLAEEWDKWIKLTLRNTRTTGRNLTSFMRLKLALAEAKILNQGGRFELMLEPLSIQFLLPLYEPPNP